MDAGDIYAAAAQVLGAELTPEQAAALELLRPWSRGGGAFLGVRG